MQKYKTNYYRTNFFLRFLTFPCAALFHRHQNETFFSTPSTLSGNSSCCKHSNCALLLFIVPYSNVMSRSGERRPGNMEPAVAGQELVGVFTSAEEVDPNTVANEFE